MLAVIMLAVIILAVIMLAVIMLAVIMLAVINWCFDLQNNMSEKCQPYPVHQLGELIQVQQREVRRRVQQTQL
jgi:hypothetical protein